MIDTKLLLTDFDRVSLLLQRKKVDPEILNKLKILVSELKGSKTTFEINKSELNKLSKQYGLAIANKSDVTTLKKEINNMKTMVDSSELLQNLHHDQLSDLLFQIPNIPDEDVPVGDGEQSNVLIREVLPRTQFPFKAKEHWELAEQNDWIDFKRGVKIAKNRFSVLKHEAAMLERALINYMLHFNRSRGFKEVSVPSIVNSNALFGTGQLPKFQDDLFKIEGDDLYLIPTSEVPLTNLFQDEILDKSELPIKMTGYTPCFRKEAGSGGKDTRGMIRQHQFHKVELVCISTQEDSDKILKEMIQCASDLLTSLELPHRLMTLCGGDLGFGAAKTIDIEVWLPGQGSYREISSVSNTRDFQSRRAKIRYKEGKENVLAHTLNGSSLAVGRTLIAIMENFQDKDGNIKIPDVLKSYLN